MANVVTRWDPFAELGELRGGIDRMLGDWLGSDSRTRLPQIDVVRDEGKLVVRADMPGIKPQEVKIEIENDILTVSGEHEETKDEKNADYVRRERRWGSFQRSLALPAGIDPKTIKATTHDGVVEVIIPMPKASKREPVTITPTAA